MTHNVTHYYEYLMNFHQLEGHLSAKRSVIRTKNEL